MYFQQHVGTVETKTGREDSNNNPVLIIASVKHKQSRE